MVEGKRYTESEFNVSIEIGTRSKACGNLSRLHRSTGKSDRVLCHPESCLDGAGYHQPEIHQQGCKLLLRVTAGDGKLGEEKLRQFQDNEKSIPTVLTTSRNYPPEWMRGM